MLGLAAGDAVGTAVEFEAPGSFSPVTEMTGGGPFRLRPGEWTDDTSMALCLAESLVERGEFDPRDQMERYVRWWVPAPVFAQCSLDAVSALATGRFAIHRIGLHQ
jgi:ADP-ribosyl-[dinitrogen reductase] hydrolase